MIDLASLGTSGLPWQQFVVVIVGIVLILVATNFYSLNETRNRNSLFNDDDITENPDADVEYLLNKANELSTQLRKTVVEIFGSNDPPLTVRELQLLAIYMLLRNRARRRPGNVWVLVFSGLSRKRYRTLKKTHADLFKLIFSMIYRRALGDARATDFQRTLSLIDNDLQKFVRNGAPMTTSIGEMKDALHELAEGHLALKGDIYEDLNFQLPRFGDFVKAKIDSATGPFKLVDGRILVLDGKSAQLMNLMKTELDPPYWEAFVDLFLRESTRHGKKGDGPATSATGSGTKKKKATIKLDLKFAKESIRKDDKSEALADLLLEFRKYREYRERSLE